MMDVYELQANLVARLPVPGWECFFGRHDVDFYPLAFYVWVVRNAACTGLIDTGLPLGEVEQRQLEEACQGVDKQCTFSNVVTLDSLLQKRELLPEQVDFVLLTQTITYHSGGLLPQFFPRAQVYISRAGLMEFLLETPGHPPRNLYFTEASWLFLRSLLIEGRLHLVNEHIEVIPGLVFETTGGHHPGSAAVRVKTESGTVGILETAFLKRNVDEELPIGIAENVRICREVIRRYKRECDLVLAGHDPTILDRFPQGVVR
jgi:glyoxylase-like metal-dependent hydrolase (beta-lactamase superfamily II)